MRPMRAQWIAVIGMTLLPAALLAQAGRGLIKKGTNQEKRDSALEARGRKARREGRFDEKAVTPRRAVAVCCGRRPVCLQARVEKRRELATFHRTNPGAELRRDSFDGV
jgi:hypothetical protein